ncbi:2'-5' RNA ligase family protein [Kitasatospora sp. NPDC056076]|uniref:2'-5' RNA ligase family protein n=1 Tax=Kitasatospora sp. NPDC056076 TaxID=3345703 RepID=UPI0035D7E792
MDDFFSRVQQREHAWPTGRRDLHWHILPQPQAAEQLVGPYRDIAATPGLHPVPPQWLHITVLHAGVVDDVTDNELTAIVGRVRDLAADIEPFDLILGRVSVGNVALESAGYPGAPARRLWEMTARANREVVGDRWPLIPTQWYPHSSIAYAGPDGHLADRTTLKARLSDVEAAPVTVPVTSISLVSQWHDGHSSIRWSHLLDVPLGAPAGTP